MEDFLIKFFGPALASKTLSILEEKFKKSETKIFEKEILKAQEEFKSELINHIPEKKSVDKWIKNITEEKYFQKEIYKIGAKKTVNTIRCNDKIREALAPIQIEDLSFEKAWEKLVISMAASISKKPVIEDICKHLLTTITHNTFRMSDLHSYLQSLKSICNHTPIIFQEGLYLERANWMVDVVRVRLNNPMTSNIQKNVSLMELLNETGRQKRGRAWVIEGSAGSGKSILLKLLAKKLIEQNELATSFNQLRFVPILINLQHPLENHPWQQALKEMGIEDEGNYSNLFNALAEKQDGLCILVDSFDELKEGKINLAKERINALRNRQLLNATIFIASRPLFWKWQDIRICKVNDLDHDAKTEILKAWIQDKAKRYKILQEISSDKKLKKLTSSPLMLALVVKTETFRHNNQPIQSVKASLLSDYVDALLRQAHRHDTVPPGPDLSKMRILLGRLAFFWHKNNSERSKISAQFVDENLNSSGLFSMSNEEGELELFRTHVLKNGLLNLNADKTWEWGHRYIQEFLAADYLHRNDDSESLLREIDLDQRDTRAIWAQVLALYCALDPTDPISRMRKTCQGYADLETRTIEELDGVPYPRRLRALIRCNAWSTRTIEKMVFQAQSTGEKEEVIDWAFDEALHSEDLFRLSFMYHLLCSIQGSCPSDFFKDIGLTANTKLSFDIVKVPEVEILEQNINGMKNRYTVPAFGICSYPITNQQYHIFLKALSDDLGFELCINYNDDCPVVNVSWYEANLFCHWAGLELPTEQQWFAASELGCKNDPPGKFMEERAWFIKDLPHKVRPVRQKEKDALGLWDMSGNVWEWCRDWFNPDIWGLSGESVEIDPQKRCYKIACGGCYSVEPTFCTSNARTYGPPGDSLDCVGFRPVLKLLNPPDQKAKLEITFQMSKDYGFKPYNRYTETFNKNYAPAYDLLKKAVTHALDVLSTKIGDKLRILDIGCGDGWMLAFLSEYFQRSERKPEVLYVGVDPNKKALEKVKDTAFINVRTICNGAEIFEGNREEKRKLHQALDRKKLDLILCTATGHQIRKGSEREDPSQDGSVTVKQLYRKMAGYLKPFGLFLVGDYEYKESLSVQETEKSLFWIRSKTGQDPTSAGGFVSRASLSSEVNLGIDKGWIVEIYSDSGQANNEINLSYYTAIWEKRDGYDQPVK